MKSPFSSDGFHYTDITKRIFIWTAEDLTLKTETEREKKRTARKAGRNDNGRKKSVSELLKSGRDIEKIYVLRGEREGSITKIVAIARERGIVVDETDKNVLTSFPQEQTIRALRQLLLPLNM